MGEADGVHKRRMFRWPKEARELVREYKERTSRSQEHTETGPATAGHKAGCDFWEPARRLSTFPARAWRKSKTSVSRMDKA